jgi:hypothetical protein
MPSQTPTNAAVEKQAAGLVHYSAMCREIQHCARVDEVKNIRDKAMALAVYAKQALNYDAERRAAEVRLRAEIKAGELLKTVERAKPGQAGGGTDGRGVRPSVKPKLSDLGVTKEQSSQWQRLADVPETEREAYIAAEPYIPTANGLLARHEAKTRTIEAQQPPVNTDATWVWGRLCDFERMGIIELTAGSMIRNLPDNMKQDMIRLTPVVTKWLTNFAKEIQ